MTPEVTLSGMTGEGLVSPREVSPERASDFALAQRAARGDVEAFEEIFRRNHRLVYGLCLRMTQDVAEAEDVTQEVFILLLRKVGGYRGEANFTTWLHRLTVNQVLMRFRRNRSRREDALEEVEPQAPALATGARRPSQLIDRITLERAIAKLPPGYRAAFVLHDVEGYEHEEVAQMMGCAVGTSKSQLHKARAKLRKILAG